MWSDNGATSQARSNFVGFSPIGGVCTQDRYSIVEESGGFKSAPVI